MKINIDDVNDIGKLIGAIRVMAKGEFKVGKELLDDVLTRLSRVAKERGIAIKIISPSGERIVEFTVGGVIVGAALGFYIGQLPGSLIGAALGGVTGFCAAHMTLVMDTPSNTDHVIITIE